MITTVTLNASIDKAYYMAKPIENGTVMRVAKCINTAGGKGLNVARAARHCGSTVNATGLVGGYNGMYLEHLLDEDGISHEFGHVSGETRSCINILDEAYGSTEYLEPGCLVTEQETKDFLENVFPKAIAESDVVTISGSAPKGVPATVYQDLIKAVKDAGKKVLLDTSGKLLEEGLKAAPDLVKPNRDELEALFDTKIETMEDTMAMADKLRAMGIPYVVISLGKDGALLVCDRGAYQGLPPKVDVVNTVGCGDSMIGAFAYGFEQNYEPEEMLKYAVAVASANACSEGTGYYETENFETIYKDVVIKKLR